LDFATVATLTIAVYGAALSTFVLLRNIDADERRFALGVERRLTPQCPRADVLRVRVTNTGKRPLTIIDVAFRTREYQPVAVRRGTLVRQHGRLRIKRLYDEANLPATLRDGQTALYTFVMDDLLHAKPAPKLAVVTDSEYHQQAISVTWDLEKTRDGRRAFERIMRKAGAGPLHTCNLYP
jgi:hypothetical protein